jgi:hypothetical protein
MQTAFAQNNTNSPYTRYGYGELVDVNSAEQRSMGGVALGTRNGLSINAANPASYSSVDSMSFMFDFGLTGLVSRFSDPSGSKNSYNSNLEYVNIQFPVNKWMGISAGLLPYSFSGYNFYKSDSVQISNHTSTPTYGYYTKTFTGNGGISQVYTGLGFKLFDHISLGVNAYYMFGNVTNNRSLVFTNSGFNSSVQSNTIRVSSFRFRYGLQAFHTFNKKHDFTLGLIYEAKAPLNGHFSQINFSTPADTIVYSNDFEVPMMYGAGIFYTFDKKLSFGLDYSMQKWGDARFFSQTDSLRNRSKLAIGAEYIPDPRGRSYFERIKYRFGFNIHDPYYKISGLNPVKNFGITFGVGLPLKTSNTVVNAAVEYGKAGDQSVFREDYFKFTLNATFNENWFFKRKL